MSPDSETTTVVFRVFKDYGDVIALFPYESWNGRGHISSYQRIGQHGAADYNSVLDISRPAKPSEYKSLKRELEGLGYVLTVRKRRSFK